MRKLSRIATNLSHHADGVKRTELKCPAFLHIELCLIAGGRNSIAYIHAMPENKKGRDYSRPQQVQVQVQAYLQRTFSSTPRPACLQTLSLDRKCQFRSGQPARGGQAAEARRFSCWWLFGKKLHRFLPGGL